MLPWQPRSIFLHVHVGAFKANIYAVLIVYSMFSNDLFDPRPLFWMLYNSSWLYLRILYS